MARNEREIDTEAVRRPDGWSRDKRSIVAWVASLIGAAVLSWGVWSTVSVFALQAASSLSSAEIKANEAQSRERDKQLADIAAERTAAMMTQLAQIQTQLAEIQRDLRRGNHQ